MWLFNLLFSSLSQLLYVEVRISQRVSVITLKFEITRVDCISSGLVPFCLWFHMWRLFCLFFFPHLSFFWCLGKEYVRDITKTSLFKYTENFTTKNENFQIKILIFFHICTQNIDCGYSLETPHRGCSNEYHNLFEQK